MAFSLKVTKDPAAVKESGGNQFISTSGIYDVTINFVSLEEGKHGETIMFNMNIDYNGDNQVIYGHTIQNSDGSENIIGRNLLNKLLILAGLEEGQEPTISEETHKVGKDNKEQEFTVIEELSGLPIKLQVKEEFTKYNGDIKRKLVPTRVFAENGATVEELIAYEEDPNVELGKQYKKLMEHEATTKYIAKANAGTGEPAPTDEEIKAFKENKQTKKPAPAPKKKGPLFGKKK